LKHVLACFQSCFTSQLWMVVDTCVPLFSSSALMLHFREELLEAVRAERAARSQGRQKATAATTIQVHSYTSRPVTATNTCMHQLGSRLSTQKIHLSRLAVGLVRHAELLTAQRHVSCSREALPWWDAWMCMQFPMLCKATPLLCLVQAAWRGASCRAHATTALLSDTLKEVVPLAAPHQQHQGQQPPSLTARFVAGMSQMPAMICTTRVTTSRLCLTSISLNFCCCLHHCRLVAPPPPVPAAPLHATSAQQHSCQAALCQLWHRPHWQWVITAATCAGKCSHRTCYRHPPAAACSPVSHHEVPDQQQPRGELPGPGAG
jgi:hypothetical protein